MRGYINHKGQFTQVLHGDKASEMVGNEIIEYEVKEFADLARINFLSLGKDKVQKLEQQNKELVEWLRKELTYEYCPIKNKIVATLEFEMGVTFEDKLKAIKGE